uniref:Uncharacterized protein n=1 Tax=Tetradesmus obliquus TaxID=3088 RepID=A0A383VDX2_TETOB|eukprot:jgi/Sobl393_1/5683/SZX62922.1
MAVFAAGVHAAVPEGCRVEVDFFATPEALGINLTRTTGYTNGNISNPIIETCSGTTDCNYPDVWSKASQEKAAGSSNFNAGGGLMKVVLPKTVDAVLYFQVTSPYLTADASSANDICLGPLPVIPTRRMLAEQVSYNVTTPGTMTYTVQIGDAAPQPGVVTGTNGGKLIISRDEYLGEQCATITINITGIAFTPAFDNFTAITPITRTVCWFKPTGDEHATAEVLLSTKGLCDVTAEIKTIAVNISSITPQPVYMKLGNDVKADDDMNPQALLRPVIYLRGTKITELDGTAATTEFDQETDIKNFLVSYIIPPLPMPEDGLYSMAIPASLQQGVYNVTARVSMITNNPELVGIGKTRIVQSDVPAVHNLTEVMAKDLFVDETFGVQQDPTLLTDISSDKEGQAITTSQNITFTWAITGVVFDQKCTHGSDAAVSCKSPFTVAAKDVSADPIKFTVDITDVCGAEKKLEYSYSAQGVTALTKVDDIPVGPGGGAVPPKKNGAAATAAAGMLTLGMGLLAALL